MMDRSCPSPFRDSPSYQGSPKQERTSLHLYKGVILTNYFPTILHRFGYGRIPLSIRHDIEQLEDWKNNVTVVHFWDCDPVPGLEPVNQDCNIEDEGEAQIPISDSSSTDSNVNT